MTMMLTTAHTLSSKPPVLHSSQGSHGLQEASEHVKCGQSQLIPALSIKYAAGFQDPSMKKEYELSHYYLYIDYMWKWYFR